MSETPDYTEAIILVKHTSKTEELFSFPLFQFSKRQICILYIETPVVKAGSLFALNTLIPSRQRLTTSIRLATPDPIEPDKMYALLKPLLAFLETDMDTTPFL